MKLTGTAILKDDTLVFRNRSEVLRFCKSLNCSEFTYTIEKKKSKRSDPQNKYYWAVVVPIVRQVLIYLGNYTTLEIAHEFIKSEFNNIPIINEKSGIIMNVPQSTTQLTKSRFSEMVAEIQVWCMEWGNTYLPDPNEQTEIDYR